MTGPEMPEFDELDPEASTSGGDESGAPDWLDFEPPDESTLAEPRANPGEPAEPVVEPEGSAQAGRRDGLRASGYIPVARNGQNGHGMPRAARSLDRRGRPAPTGRRVAPGLPFPPAEDNLPAALAAAAAVASDSEEAALLAAALVPLALAAAESGERALRPAVPALVKGIAALAMWLIEEDSRDLIRLLPLILEETVRDLGRAAADGRPITRGLAGDRLAEQTERALSRHGNRDHGNRIRGNRRPSDRAEHPRGPARPQRPAGPPPRDEWDDPDDSDYR
jgi:hypothetical protein